MRSIVSLFFLMIFYSSMFAQPVFERSHEIPVIQNGDTINKAWLGGLKNPQFNKADLNNNGVDDLVVFDKAGNYLMTFLNNNIPGEVSYTYAPEFVQNFPLEGTPRVQNWMLMTDFSCNGIADLFVSGNARIEYFRGYYDNDVLKFEYVDFLRYQGFTGPLNIFISTVDYPAIADVNGDGAKDVLAFHMLGGYVQYFKNLSMDTHGNCDGNLVFEAADNCWGQFHEGSTKKGVNFLEDCVGLFQPPFENPETRRHAGSTLLALDMNNNGLKDLILGDVEFSNLTMLINGGTPDSAKMIYQDSLFPKYDVSVDLPTMPAAFHIDVDNDGLKDLIVSPTDLFSATENVENAWFYKNVGNQDTVILALQTKSFIGEDMIDAGATSRPYFIDLTGNGIQDLVIGNNGYYAGQYTRRAALTFYENVGTQHDPLFKLISRDFGGLSQLNKEFLAPAFGDITGNGKKEMVVGDESGNLHLFINTANTGQPATFVLHEMNWLELLWTFSTPYFFDVNGNGKLDLLIGERQGTVKLHLNQGTEKEPQFIPTPDNNTFGKIDTRKVGFFDGYSTPHVLETDENTYILSGSEERGLLLYAFNPDSILEGSFDLLIDDYAQTYAGRKTAPADYTINNTPQYITVGNFRGGLQLYKNTDSVISSAHESKIPFQSEKFTIYPNPADNHLTIETSTQIRQNAQVQLFDISGKEIDVNHYRFSENQFQLNISNLSSGVYFIQVKQNDYLGTGKFIKK